ncbi:ATP-binding protein [Nocardiopsis sp. CNT-189]|uniref:hypothetical protein n=1 Tax=Nocardiopsis oceanisediminis TaxID=2816862 RepID=UPI003B33905E
MSPRLGGQSDKIGNRYERAWTTARLLEVLAGRAEWVRVEPLGDLGKGVEFVLRGPQGLDEAHQVKRQSGNANEWTFARLKDLGIWEAAWKHIEAGRDYHFVSTVPFRPLQELTDRVRDSNDLASFIQESLPGTLNLLFQQVVSLCGGTPIAYRLLRRFHVRLIDEAELRRNNNVMAEWMLEGGSGAQSSALLGELADDSFDAVLTADRILEALRPHGLRRRLAVSSRGLAERVHVQTSSWLAQAGLQMLNPVIARNEAERLRGLVSAAERVHFLTGAAGSGKTAVLHQAVTGLVAEGVPTLAVRIDRFGELGSTADLGEQSNLGVSPVAALAAAADGRPAVLVIDQLDAVSSASGRLRNNFDVVAGLVIEAMAIADLHVVLGCRRYDLEEDHRILALKKRYEATVLSVAPLDEGQVEAAVVSLGLSAAALSPGQRELLRLPLHLMLLAVIADEPEALDFTSGQRLFDAYWEHKRRAVRERREPWKVRFGEVMGRLAEVISERQELSVPVSALDAEDLADDADVLVSEQVLVRDGGKIAFFHESVFDYAFARQWVNRRSSIVDFLTSGEQELFRRGQVRQIMVHLRSTDPVRFVEEARALLVSERVRFHIKDSALAVLSRLEDPGSAEADMLLEAGGVWSELGPRLRSRLRSPAWFARLDADGHVAVWLRADAVRQEHALGLMAGAVSALPGRVAELLAEHTETPFYPAWLRQVARFADPGADRALFDLVLGGIRGGHYDGHERLLWHTVHGLVEGHCEWVVEVFAAFLAERPAGLAVDGSGRVALLKSRSHQSSGLVRKTAEGAPRCFRDALLPYLLQVMTATAKGSDGGGRRLDAQFSLRFPEADSGHDLGRELFYAMAWVLRWSAETDPVEARPALERLAEDPHESAQWLLYQGLSGGGAAYAEWAGELLLQGRHRFLSGYSSNGVWAARQVLEAISPHLSDALFGRLEAEIRDLRFPWEQGRPAWYAFTLLSAMEEGRLSEAGRRRLAELRRAVGTERPPEPQGVITGRVEAPIPAEAAARMSDGNWLQAMAKHTGRGEGASPFKGGALEQSRVLQEQAKQDPERFARLALRLTAEVDPVYGDALLIGLGEAGPLAEEDLVFDAVRHIASLGHSANDCRLGSALLPYSKTVPLDLVELLRDRLLCAEDPADDGVRIWSGDGAGNQVPDVWLSGFNTARGSLPEILAELLFRDVDGERTALVAPYLDRLAEEPAITVRACLARLFAAAMRHAGPIATAASWKLLRADDALLAEQPVVGLLVLLGGEDPGAIAPVVTRMLAAQGEAVRETGGRLAAFAGLEWGVPAHLDAVLASEDSAARKGAAGLVAQRLPSAGGTGIAAEALTVFMNDTSDEVRREAAQVVGALRGHALRPFEGVLTALMASASFPNAVPYLLHTLEQAPDRVDRLVLACARRYVEVFGAEVADLRTGAAADAREVGRLVIRGLAQTRSSEDRAALLDVLDRLLLSDAYGVDELVNAFER